MAVSSYVVVDTPSKKIIGGPYKWDGVAAWTPPVAGTLILESAAKSGGYTYPAPPPPSATEQNEKTLQDKAAQALTSNKTYLALPSPTAAQSTAQVKALTQQCNALIRLQLDLLDDTSGT